MKAFIQRNNSAVTPSTHQRLTETQGVLTTATEKGLCDVNDFGFQNI
jgi:hypothetical protein